MLRSLYNYGKTCSELNLSRFECKRNPTWCINFNHNGVTKIFDCKTKIGDTGPTKLGNNQDGGVYWLTDQIVYTLCVAFGPHETEAVLKQQIEQCQDEEQKAELKNALKKRKHYDKYIATVEQALAHFASLNDPESVACAKMLQAFLKLLCKDFRRELAQWIEGGGEKLKGELDEDKSLSVGIQQVVFYYESDGIGHLHKYAPLMDWYNEKLSDFMDKNGCKDKAVCSVTGKLAKPARIFPKVTATSKSLISRNDPYSWHWGLEGGSVDPISEDAAQIIQQAFEHLLNRQYFKIEKTAPKGSKKSKSSELGRILYWIDKESKDLEEIISNCLLDVEPKLSASDLKKTIEDCCGAKLLEGCNFSWMQCSLMTSVWAIQGGGKLQVFSLKDNLERWAEKLDSVFISDWKRQYFKQNFHNAGERIATPSIKMLVDSISNRCVNGELMVDLWYSAFYGSPISRMVFSAVLDSFCHDIHNFKNTIEGRVNLELYDPNRIALLRAACNDNGKSNIMAGLDESRSTYPYVLGRILSISDQIYDVYHNLDNIKGKRDRNGTRYASKTLIPRFMNGLLTDPCVTFTELQAEIFATHLDKIQRDCGGLHYKLKTSLISIIGKLDAGNIPTSFSEVEKAELILGFAHQEATRNHKNVNTTKDGEENGSDQ